MGLRLFVLPYRRYLEVEGRFVPDGGGIPMWFKVQTLGRCFENTDAHLLGHFMESCNLHFLGGSIFSLLYRSDS